MQRRHDADRVIEVASRVRLTFAVACTEAELLTRLPPRSCRAVREQRGRAPPLVKSDPPNAFGKRRSSDGEKPNDQPRERSTRPATRAFVA